MKWSRGGMQWLGAQGVRDISTWMRLVLRRFIVVCFLWWRCGNPGFCCRGVLFRRDGLLDCCRLFQPSSNRGLHGHIVTGKPRMIEMSIKSTRLPRSWHRETRLPVATLHTFYMSRTNTVLSSTYPCNSSPCWLHDRSHVSIPRGEQQSTLQNGNSQRHNGRNKSTATA